MITRNYTIIDESGIHARPASLLTQVAMKYNGTVDIEYNGSRNTLKSIMIVMSLGIPQNAEITIVIEDEKEELAIKEIEKVFTENHLI
jgi:phosphocarrier protein